jgi:hypothetical protein
MDAKDAVRRVLDGEERVEVKDRRGGGVVAYYRKADGLLYVCDRRGERPINDYRREAEEEQDIWALLAKAMLPACSAVRRSDVTRRRRVVRARRLRASRRRRARG